MKKKHRDIVVDGVKYGWTVDWSKLKIWKDKKVIATHDIPERHDITPSIVAGLIKDPVDTLILLNAEPCPFCGGGVEKAAKDWEDDYYVCSHEDDCWLYPATPYNLIPKNKIKIWNTRS